MDKQKLIDKLLKKYPELNDEPMFDDLLSMEDAEEAGEEEMPMEEEGGEHEGVEIEINPEDMGGEDEGESMDDEEPSLFDGEEEAPEDKKKQSVKELIKARMMKAKK